MEKEIVKKQLLWMKKDTPITWKDIKHIEFQDDDIIQSGLGLLLLLDNNWRQMRSLRKEREF